MAKSKTGKQTAYGIKPLPLLLLLIVNLIPATGISSEMEIDYDVVFKGVEDPDLLQVLSSVSDTMRMSEQKIATTGLLRKRMDGDISVFLKAMRSEGYYRPKIDSEIDSKATPVLAVFTFKTGPAYLIKSVVIRTGKDEIVGPGKPEEIGLEVGAHAKAVTILQSQENLLNWFRERGSPFAEVAKRNVVVDHAGDSLSIEFIVDPGPVARFGPLRIEGLVSVDEEIISSKIPWKPGDRFNGGLLKKAQTLLAETMLFASIEISLAETVDENGLLPVTVTVEERKHRTVGVGLGYKTDEGLVSRFSWEHRNLLGMAEHFSIFGVVSDITTEAEVEFLKPMFLRPDQEAVINMRLAEDTPDAYTSKNFRTSALVRREVSKGMIVGGGLAFKHSDVEQRDEKETFNLASMPLIFDWDTSDNLFSPSRGGRLNIRFAPYYEITGNDLSFYRTKASYARYIQLSEKPSIIIAVRAAIGSITGAERDEIPADERFYAGGGGSLRGYPYETVSPLIDNDPVGGRSILNLSAELRIGITEKIGIVPFIDAGNAFEDAFPDFSEDLLYGAGIGLRYATPIGPLRLDFAVPLDRRDDIDDSFQIYVNFGNAF